MANPKLDAQMICDLCDSIKKDIRSGRTDRETELKSLNMLRQIASWRRGYNVIVTCDHTSP